MKIAIITDQHFGCRKNSKVFHDFFLKFYNDVLASGSGSLLTFNNLIRGKKEKKLCL